MRKYMSILGLFLSINFCNGQIDTMPTKTMLNEFNLKEKVKTVIYCLFPHSEKLFFDENGMLVKHEIGTTMVFDNYV